LGDIYINNSGKDQKHGGCLPAILSFIIPGLGQLLAGHPIKAICHFVVAVALWCVLMGWIIHLYSAWDANR